MGSRDNISLKTGVLIFQFGGEMRLSILTGLSQNFRSFSAIRLKFL